MPDAKTTNEILSMYAKHGWSLRRVLLSPKGKTELAEDAERIFDGIRPVDSDIDAAWFSRTSKPGNETWELRRLSSDGFALCEVFSDEDEEEAREEAMYEMEARLMRR
jgi:hypothetical protein